MAVMYCQGNVKPMGIKYFLINLSLEELPQTTVKGLTWQRSLDPKVE